MVGGVDRDHPTTPRRGSVPVGRRDRPRSRSRLAHAVAAIVLLGSVTLSSCSGEVLDDRVRIAGSETLRTYLSAASGAFLSEQPSAEVVLDLTGTGEGLSRLCDGLVEVAAASRPINDRERRACEQSGVEPVELSVGLDAVALVTAPDTGPVCLTPTQLYAATGPESTGFDDWSAAQALAQQIDPATPALALADTDVPLTVFGPRSGSGTVDTYVEFAVEPLATERGASSELRADITPSPSSGLTITESIAGPASLGIVGYAELARTEEQGRPVQVLVNGTCVAPDATSIANGTYPIQRDLRLYVDRDVATTNETAVRLIELVISDAGQELADRVGVVRVPADQLAATRSTWSSTVG